MSRRALLLGAGSGILLTLSYTTQLLSPNHFAIYFYRFPTASVFLGMLIDLVAISLAADLVWYWVEKLNGDSFFWPFIVPCILVAEAYCLGKLWAWPVPRLYWVLLGTFLVPAAFVLRRFRRVWFKRTVRGACGSVVLFGFSIFWVVPELAYLAVRTSSPEAAGFDHKTGMLSDTGARIVWIVFDELSYDQTFESRWPDLALPNFDRMRAESAMFAAVEPVEFYTQYVMSSLLLGRPVSQIRTSASGATTFYFQDTHTWEPFEAAQTILADARRQGWTTGIVGWSIPYCRILHNWVDNCYWVSDDDPIIDGTNVDPGHTSLQNAFSLLMKSAQVLMPRIASSRSQYLDKWVSRRQSNYQSVMQHALALIQDSTIRFALIHLPVPHPPAFYDRKARAFSAGGSYVDNLALADIALGELLDALQRTSGWPETTLIVCGDHSWRPSIWTQYFWTPEDQTASRGAFDPRPVLLIHLPAQSRGETYTHRVKALSLHNVLSALLHGSIRSQASLALQMGSDGALTR